MKKNKIYVFKHRSGINAFAHNLFNNTRNFKKKIIKMTTFFVKTVLGASHRITLDPTEKDPVTVCASIQRQLPASYNNNNFRVVCEGKDLKTFEVFPNGVDQYFSKLNNIFVLGSMEASGPLDQFGQEEKIKVKLLARLRKFEEKGYTLSKKFTMESRREEILHELALLHVIKDMQDAKSDEVPLPVRQCIAWGCGNFLAPDEDLRCKICDY